MKIHDIKSIVVNNIRWNYFAKREKNGINGKPRYTVYIIDPDGGGVYEKAFTTYNLPDALKNYVENCLEEDLENDC